MKSLNVSAPINSLSYGIVARNLIHELSKLTTVCLNPIQLEETYTAEFLPLVGNYWEQFDMYAPSLRIYHENLIMDHMGKGQRVAFPFFERNVFDRVTRFNIKNQDLVLTTSTWGKEIIEKHGQNNVHIVPLGVEDCFRPDPNAFKRKDKIIFLNIGKYEVRKGHDVMAEYFCEAFENVPDVELWMMMDNPFVKQEEMGNVKLKYKTYLGNKVSFINRLHIRELVRVINEADIGLFLSRAEGWNLPLLECMACGKDIVATNYSAHTAYLPDMDGVFKIEPNGEEIAADGKWFFGDFSWMSLTACKEQIIEQLRAAYKRQKENRKLNEDVSRYAKGFTWENTARNISTKLGV